jgi:transposase InsO family protein
MAATTSKKEIIVYAVSMILKAAVLAAAWAGRSRKRELEAIANMTIEEKDKEIVFLRDRVHQLETQVQIFQKQYHSPSSKPRYSLKERLFILWHMEYFQVPRRKVTEIFGIARSTLYRWLKELDDETDSAHQPWNKTPDDLAILVWRIAGDNIHWGRIRIANQLRVLGIFLSASTVRNILNRPHSKDPSPAKCAEKRELLDENGCRIPAWYPNHLWSVDLTEVYYWGLWKIYIFVAIDHYSRKVITVIPLEGANAGWVINAQEAAFAQFGVPKYLVSDQGPQFTCAALVEFLSLDAYKVQHRFGAVGQHGSIAVTERVIETLKYEWLKRVAVIRGYSHLLALCESFAIWYNDWRPHEFLGSATPGQVYRDKAVPFVPKLAKSLPDNIAVKRFAETNVTGYRLKQAA